MVTASIVIYKTPEELIKKILYCSHTSIIEKIYVIDNSPTDSMRRMILDSSDKVIYIYGHGNIGYGAAHNVGIKEAMKIGADYHVVLNPDIRFAEGTIEALEAFAKNHIDIGMIMPNVIYPNGRQQYLCKLSPSPLDILGRRLLPDYLFAKRNARYEMRETGYDRIRNVPCLSGCFMFLNLQIIERVGLFDERFFMYFEDFDLIRRIHKVSKTIFFPKVTIIHDHAGEHRTNKKLLKISIESTIKYFNKWGWIFDLDRKLWNKYAFDSNNIISE